MCIDVLACLVSQMLMYFFPRLAGLGCEVCSHERLVLFCCLGLPPRSIPVDRFPRLSKDYISYLKGNFYGWMVSRFGIKL